MKHPFSSVIATFHKSALAFAAALLFSVGSGAHAGSSATSLAAEGASSAAGSASDSLGTSSNSSSKATGVAAGDYKIVDVAAAPNQPGMVQLKLVAVKQEGAAPVTLTLPEQALNKSGLGQGDVVTASDQTYGLKFANAKTQQAFFLVIHDDIYRELASNPISL